MTSSRLRGLHFLFFVFFVFFVVPIVLGLPDCMVRLYLDFLGVASRLDSYADGKA